MYSSPVRHSTGSPKGAFAFDLHVLTTPPAFVLSQDQTLQLMILSIPTNRELVQPRRLTLVGRTCLGAARPRSPPARTHKADRSQTQNPKLRHVTRILSRPAFASRRGHLQAAVPAKTSVTGSPTTGPHPRDGQHCSLVKEQTTSASPGRPHRRRASSIIRIGPLTARPKSGNPRFFFAGALAVPRLRRSAEPPRACASIATLRLLVNAGGGFSPAFSPPPG